MRQVTTREKAFLGIGIVAALAIFVYFIFLPMLQGDQSDSTSSLEELQEKLESVKKLESMAPSLVGLEKQMREQSGCEKISFKRGLAGSAIFSYLAQAAAQANIEALEQLDPKPYTSRKTDTKAVSDQAILKSVVDQMYLAQVIDEAKQENNSPDASEENKNMETDEQKAPAFNPDQFPPVVLKFIEERGVSIEELKKNPELREKLKREFEKEMMGKAESDNPPDEPEISKTEDAKPDRSDEAVEQTKTQKLTFPPIPKDIPNEVKQSLAKLVKTHPGKTIVLSDINWILDDAGVGEEKEIERIRKRLRLYGERVTEIKNELRQWLDKIDIKNVKTGQKADKFTVKMVFKSQMDQLVKLLYNLQESARWLKIESMRISISDRKETLLSVELSMTATTLYDL